VSLLLNLIVDSMFISVDGRALIHVIANMCFNRYSFNIIKCFDDKQLITLDLP